MQDDLQDLLGIKQDPEEALALKELARRANDTFRVYNPTKEDYRVAWDTAGAGGYFIIPGANHDLGFGPGQNVHPRYIAFKFFKEITNIILSAEMQMAIEAENERRAKNGMKPMDKTAETVEELRWIGEKKLMPTNQEKLMELLPKIILGIEREWGMDAIPYKKQEDQVKWEDVLAIVNRPASNNVAKPDVPAGMAVQGADPLKGVAA